MTSILNSHVTHWPELGDDCPLKWSEHSLLAPDMIPHTEARCHLPFIIFCMMFSFSEVKGKMKWPYTYMPTTVRLGIYI